MKTFNVILALIIYQVSFGQSGNFTALVGTGDALYFDEEYNIQMHYGERNDMGNGYSQSSDNGHLTYSVLGNIVDDKGTNMVSPTSFSTKSVGLKLNDSSILVFEEVFDKYVSGRPVFSLKVTELAVTIGGSSVLLVPGEYRQLFLDQTTYGIEGINDTSGGAWLIVRTSSSSFTSFHFSDSKVPDQSLVSTFLSMYNPIFESNTDVRHTIAQRDILKRSPSGNYIASIDNFSVRGNAYPLEDWHNINVFLFNKGSGQLSFVAKPLSQHDTALYDSRNATPRSFQSCEFSSNDKYVYYSYVQAHYSNNMRKSYVSRLDLSGLTSELLYETIFDNNASDRSQLTREVFDLKLCINNELLLLRNGNKDGRYGYYFDALLQSNGVNPSVESKKYFFEESAAFYAFGNSKYNYIRVQPKYDYNCQAAVSFNDACDYSLPNTSAHYFSEEVAGSGVLTYRGETPTITYSENGDYVYKVVLKSHEGIYKEVKVDTIKVRIPDKPVANFRATDTVMCAYQKTEFINLSTSKAKHPQNGENWVWTFGDGETKSQSSFSTITSHIYEEPGVYEVTLEYSNGYCDSTIVKIGYIRVVSAPKAGFAINSIQGCAPVTLSITDTVTLNTIRKQYNFGDSWVTVPVDEPYVEHTFKESGNYWIVQRLRGYTGCITQTDSVRVYISSGFTDLDTSHIINASYQDVSPYAQENEVISVILECNDGTAVEYNIYKNSQLIKTISTNQCAYGYLVFFDTLENRRNQIIEYSAEAVDSCGTATHIGRIGGPILISGEIKGTNKFAVINFSPYLGWKVLDNEISYSLETSLITGDVQQVWTHVQGQNSIQEFIDHDLLNPNDNGIQRERCYRVIGKSDNNKTISNIVCLPFLPVIFSPNAITPNNDGLNDVYRPITFGIENYKVDIYNRYGQKIAQFDQTSKGWKATEIPMGAYVAIIRAKGVDNHWYNVKQTVTVIR